MRVSKYPKPPAAKVNPVAFCTGEPPHPPKRRMGLLSIISLPSSCLTNTDSFIRLYSSISSGEILNRACFIAICGILNEILAISVGKAIKFPTIATCRHDLAKRPT